MFLLMLETVKLRNHYLLVSQEHCASVERHSVTSLPSRSRSTPLSITPVLLARRYWSLTQQLWILPRCLPAAGYVYLSPISPASSTSYSPLTSQCLEKTVPQFSVGLTLHSAITECIRLVPTKKAQSDGFDLVETFAWSPLDFFAAVRIFFCFCLVTEVRVQVKCRYKHSIVCYINALYGKKYVDTWPSRLHVLVEQPIPDLVPLSCYNNLHLYRKAFY